MSFFDEVEEETRAHPSTAPQRRVPRGGRRPPGGGGRPPRRGGAGRPPEEAIRVRRAVAGGALLVILILVILGVHSCQVSQANGALRDYSDNVRSVITDSNNTGQQFFGTLSQSGSASNAPALQTSLNGDRLSAEHQLSTAEAFGVPGQVKSAQQDLLLALQMRADGIGNVANQIQSALQPSTATAAVNTIAAEMARLYASDVLYKDYALPQIAGALHAAGINGQPVNTSQFFPSIQWLDPSVVASTLHVTIKGSSGSPASCVSGKVYGHALNSVSVDGTTLQPNATNTIPGSPAPTFTFNVTNGGDANESNVKLKVTLSGSSVSGSGVIAQTTQGQTTTGTVTLSASPAPGSYTLTATVEPVPCETNTSNNTLTFPVTVQ